MPTNKPRDYTKNEVYEDSPAQVKHREERNRLRAQTIKKLGHNPVGKDVAHINPLDKVGHSNLANTRLESVHKNRSWRAGQKKYNVPIDK